jgi:hypothetical protein
LLTHATLPSFLFCSGHASSISAPLSVEALECQQSFPYLPSDTISSSTQPAPPRKKPSKKAAKSNGQNGNNNGNYEHHLEKWLENTSKMNFDCSNLDGNWPFMNAPNAFQQQPPANRKGNGSHLHQYGSNDPISLPSHVVSRSVDFLLRNSCSVLFC